MKDTREVKYHLLTLLTSPVNPYSQRQELNSLIEDCFKIATVQVKYQLSKLHKPGIMGDLTAKDIAIDAIAPLFTPAADGLIYHLTGILATWSPSIESEEQARFMLISVLSHRVKQHIHSMMRESDPFFAKILDSLNYHIKKEKLIKSEKLKVCYISVDDPAKCTLDYNTYEDLLTLQATYFTIKHLSIGDILTLLESNGGDPVAIPLLALAKRIKEVNLAYENPIITCQATETDYDIEHLSSKAQDTIIEKLRHSYLGKGKLSENESRMIESALKEMMADLKDGGVKTGLYHYIESIDNSISQEMYKQKYHNILEYLLKVMKKELVHLLSVKNEFSE